MPIQSVDNLLALPGGVRGKQVLLRADFNVPMKDGCISDDTRIRATLPTIRKLLAAGAKVIVASHLGRPKGVRRAELSLLPVASRLQDLLGRMVHFCDVSTGPKATAAAARLGDGDCLLLENLRFEAGEEANQHEFSNSLAALAEIYVNDAFGAAHRAHSSIVGVVSRVPKVAGGTLLLQELKYLNLVKRPSRPLFAFLGGSKVSDKIAVLHSLASQADTLAIGGAMAYTFLAAQGKSIGNSLVELQYIDEAKKILSESKRQGNKIILPIDHVVARDLDDTSSLEVVSEIPNDMMGVDIGPQTTGMFTEGIRSACTIFWNGPMGVFELAPFSRGTEAVALAIASSQAISVVGGGDSLAAVNNVGVGSSITHLSTGGGASLEYVQGLSLPGIVALETA